MTLEDYLMLARKLIKTHGPRKMLFDNEAVGYVASYLMKADINFNNNGNIYGYRKACGKFAIMNWIDRNIKRDKKRKQVSITNMDLPCNDNVFNNVAFNEILDFIETMKPKHKDVLKSYYFEKKTLNEIGNTYGITREAVRLRLQKSISLIKEKFNA